MINKLKIDTNTKIYVTCPAYSATGGPELLHQLVYELNNIGLNAFMYYYYYSDYKEDMPPTHKAYEIYNNPTVTTIEDKKENILIVPEVKTDVLFNYKRIQKVIWWLSVDNFYIKFKSQTKIKKIIKSILYKMNFHKNYRSYKFKPNDNMIHFVQSEYAKDHLQMKNLSNIYFLSDYLNELFIVEQLKNQTINKKNIVVYNPKKGIEFTRKIINFNKNLKFIPIENMSREEVAKLLSSAKVYIDFGNHPGKDRIPREAAISGCCVITNIQGSAKYYEDVPIENEFKFDDKDKNIPNVVSKIEECFDQYELLNAKFESYREDIKHEQENFINEVKKIFSVK